VIFAHQNLIYNRLTYAKSAGKLISFGSSERSVQSSQRNAQLIAESKRKNDFTFWLIFGLSLNFFRTQRNVQRKTDLRSKMTQCVSKDTWPHLRHVEL